MAALAAAYRRTLLHLAARDLTGAATVDVVGEELADMAAAVLEAALAVARSELSPGATACRLAVVAMGKCGGRELNYASDVDVIFVAEPVKDEDETAALATARLAAGLMRGVRAVHAGRQHLPGRRRTCARRAAPGRWSARSTSHVAYYERWAKTWEFQALLKARPVAGDMALGQAYADTLGPLVWQAARRDRLRRGRAGHAAAGRARSLPARQAGRELKLGPGGLRDIEFAVQLLQLVHGRTDEALRSPATLPALRGAGRRRVRRPGRRGRARRAPTGSCAAPSTGCSCSGCAAPTPCPRTPPYYAAGPGDAANDGPHDGWLQPAVTGIRSDPAAEFDEEWRRHARQVRRLHEKLFYRPLLDAVARLPAEAAAADGGRGPRPGSRRWATSIRPGRSATSTR